MKDSSTETVFDDVLARARKIKLFLMDVDGTLTDGSISLISSQRAESGAETVVTEMKTFSAQDGQGLSLAHTMGIKTGFITGRRSPAVTQRATEMKVDFVCLGQGNKTAAFEDCMRQAGVTEEETAYMGDDLPDINIAKRAGLGVSVADGAPELKAVCTYVTQRNGGKGAAREVIELILKAQGTLGRSSSVSPCVKSSTSTSDKRVVSIASPHSRIFTRQY